MARFLMSKNHAAWIDGPGKPVRTGVHKLRTLGPREVLVRNRAVAINPYDCLQQSTGEFVEHWPCIFGHDLAGEIVSVGESVQGFAEGQRVLAQALHQSLEDTAFQEHSIVKADVTCHIPDDLTYESACVIPLALSTAAAGLYQQGYLELPLPQATAASSGKTLLVWGGSSSVGSAAIQLAVASGLDVFTTASIHNFDHCRDLGAKEVYDYRSESIIDDLVSALKKSGNVVGAFAAVSQPGTIVSDIAQILSRIGGGGFIATTKPPPKELPENVSAKMVFASDYAGVEGRKFFRTFLPAALRSGTYRATPDAYVVGKGLEHIQTGFEVLKAGVSAKKVVVSI